MNLLTRHLKSFALVSIFLVFQFSTSHSKHHIRHRHKRQHGANLFSPNFFIIPDGEGDSYGWGDWGAVSECSRTCGGGVAYQTRECHNLDRNERPLCRGGSKKYFSCNTQDCPDSDVDFRSQQCSEFDNREFEGVRYKWIPYTRAPNPCELNCMPRGERFYFRHKEKVIDGTRCNEESLDVCVDGRCLPVGCDMMLGSPAKEDKCRQCAGDGATCKQVNGTLDMNNLQVGYNDILLIPAGATNIIINERAPSNNYLAIRGLSGEFYLNGNWRIDFPRTMPYAGSFWTYERKPQGFAAPDHLTCLGPTSEPVYLVLLYQDKNVGINYEYSVPEKTRLPTNQSYIWETTSFDACNATCGGGYQQRNVSCHLQVNLEPVEENLCDEDSKPVTIQKCNQEACEPEWKSTPWSNCSAFCGTNGTQTREIHCQRIDSNGNVLKVSDDVCTDQAGKKPITVQECNIGKPCPEWHISPWMPCNKLCGEGEQLRQVKCFTKDNGSIQILNDSDCPEEKPETTRECMIRPCEGIDWITSKWSGCKACGQTKETRVTYCGSKSGKFYAESLCDATKKPELIRDCKAIPCEYSWFTSQWSKCTSECSTGIQSRNVVCASFDGTVIRRSSDESKCESATKPNNTRECEGTNECPGEWFAGPWSDCTELCGGGRKTRKVLCIADGKAVTPSNCDLKNIISASDDCNEDPCSDDKDLPTSPADIDTRFGGEDDDDDYDEDDYCDSSEVDDFDMTDTTVVKVMPSDVTAIDFDSTGSDSTEPSMTVDEVMMSDATAFDMGSSKVTESVGSTVEGSGATDLTDGSGDGSTGVTSSLSISKDTDGTEGSGASEMSTVSGIFSSTDDSFTSSTDIAETKVTESTVSGETDATTEGSESTIEVSTVSGLSTDTSSGDTETTSSDLTSETSVTESDITGSTDSSSTDLTSEVSGSTDEATGSTSTDSTDVSDTTPTDTTEMSSETPTSSDETSSDFSTDVSSTTDASSTTDTSTDVSDLTTSSSDLSASTDSDGTETTDIVTTDTPAMTEESVSTGSSGSDSTEVSKISETTSSELTESTVTSDGVTESDMTTVSSSDVTGIDSSTVSIDGSSVSEASTESVSTVSGLSSETGSSETTVSSVTEESQSTVSGLDSSESTVSGETTVSGVTEESEMTTIEDTGATTVDIWSSTDDVHATTPSAIGVFTTKKTKTCKKRKPKVQKPPKCKESEFGCCPDNRTAAKGPFDEGCSTPETCEETKYGCCPDGVSPATGKKNRGCPEPFCKGTLFGCCPDKITIAEGPDNEGCPIEPTTVTELYTTTEMGVTDATTESDDDETKDTDETGFTDSEEKTTDSGVPACSTSTYGCCSDNKTPASGPDEEGCAPCTQQPFGCCPDDKSPAHGPNNEGCCLNSPYGCCPNNIDEAKGPNLEGCGCEYSTFGCCPDNKTNAQSYDKDGCGCKYTDHGCCPDEITPAEGADFEGCPCHTFQFGCCPDGITVPKGPHGYGCHCSHSTYKCCSDGVTPANGPDLQGCSCATSKHGCCPDGRQEAKGPNFEDCDDIPISSQKACSLPRDAGTCTHNFTVKHFFDSEYGSCSRFWYGGCGGNGNRFETIEQCKEVCQEPEGKKVCDLPKIQGPCTGYFPMFYYDAERGACTQFIYGGCLGNNNRFETKEECEGLCLAETALPPCEQPAEPGPCNGTFERWFFDKESEICRPFNYGGCQPNKNNFMSEHSCNYHCKTPGVMRESCKLEMDVGGKECSEQIARWHFSEKDNQCMPFYFTGCGGNKNNFKTLEECEGACPKQIVKDVCQLPAEIGECQDYDAKWYYDTKDKRCRQFYYGGCGGNKNNFDSEEDCMARCEHEEEKPEPPVQTHPEQPYEPQELPKENEPTYPAEICMLRSETGSCHRFETKWHYSPTEGICTQFVYGGCGGNKNRFDSYEDCDQMCGFVQNICSMPKLEGSCGENITRWYYDEVYGQCSPFRYSGCRGNKNNFYTHEECMHACSHYVDEHTDHPEYPPHQPHEENPEEPYYHETPAPPVIPARGGFDEEDLCSQPRDFGDYHCDEQIESYYYDQNKKRCELFYFSGCGGNDNRFNTQHECEQRCDSASNEVDVCSLPEDMGECDDWKLLYTYDKSSKLCTQFYYGGCGGNGNRFESLDECEATCVMPKKTPTREGETQEHRPHTGHETPQYGSAPVDACERERKECAELYCPYGYERNYDQKGCEICSCENPCESHACPHGYVCIVDVQGHTEEDIAYVPMCRQENKPGECPILSNDTRCDIECYNDADCHGDKKCCQAGCGYNCVPPAEDITVAPSLYPNAHIPGAQLPTLEHKTRDEVDVKASEGGYATLRCFATGYPAPTIQWQRGGITINTNIGRYVLTTSGDLQIIQLVQSDSGTYVCVADNGVGPPVTREIDLAVGEPQSGNAYIIGEQNQTQIVSLDQPAVIRCMAGGYPNVYVSWWKGPNLLPYSSDRFEVQKDYSLTFKKIVLSDLGTYLCEAYSGIGKPYSHHVTLKAMGPVQIRDPEDEQYVKYLLNVPEVAEPHHPIVVRPPGTREPVMVHMVLYNISMPANSTILQPGKDLILDCEVSGQPTPRVTWLKNDYEIIPSSRIQIDRIINRLTITQLSEEDSGFYKCYAENEHSYAQHTEYITVEKTLVPDDCVDNPFFANCGLIVKGKYCTHKYYAKFCCRSCTLAGQLWTHPNAV